MDAELGCEALGKVYHSACFKCSTCGEYAYRQLCTAIRGPRSDYAPCMLAKVVIRGLLLKGYVCECSDWWSCGLHYIPSSIGGIVRCVASVECMQTLCTVDFSPVYLHCRLDWSNCFLLLWTDAFILVIALFTLDAFLSLRNVHVCLWGSLIWGVCDLPRGMNPSGASCGSGCAWENRFLCYFVTH